MCDMINDEEKNHFLTIGEAEGLPSDYSFTHFGIERGKKGVKTTGHGLAD